MTNNRWPSVSGLRTTEKQTMYTDQNNKPLITIELEQPLDDEQWDAFKHAVNNREEMGSGQGPLDDGQREMGIGETYVLRP